MVPGIMPHTIEVGTLALSATAKRYVNEVLESNRLSYGPFSRRLEAEFARLHGCRFGVLSNSGTSALHVALAALKEIYGWRDGDEVLVPAVTFVATANIVLHNRMTPVFVDVEKDFYGLDPSSLEQKISAKTRAIIPVHLFGLPCDLAPILEVARQHRLKIIEDSCETMFAAYRGQSVGSLGDIGCFSTYVAHLLTTGVGGISTTNNPDYAVALRSLVNHGRDAIYLSIDDDDVNGEKLKEIVAKRFSFVRLGHSFRITEMEAAIGVAQLETREAMMRARRGHAAYLTRALAPLEDVLQLPGIRPGCDHSFMMYPLVARQQEKRELVEFLEAHNVETRDMMPLINQPVYQRLFAINVADYPVADWINRNGFYVGCHQNLSRQDLDTIVELLMTYFKRRP